MLQKFKPHFLKIGPRRFVIASVIILFVLDLLNSYYLKIYWMSKNFSMLMVQRTIEQSQAELSSDAIAELVGVVDNSFYFFILIILVNNLFFYLFYLRKKLWAQGFVLFYTLTAALFSVSFIFDNAGLGFHWLAYNIATIPLYLYLYIGVKLLKNETTLEHEKKGL